MKPFFDGLPKEVEEAAVLDGLSPVRVFWRIALPMSSPGLYTVMLFSFVAGWVDLLFGITFSTTPGAMPLTAGLMQMQTGYKIYWGPMMAGGSTSRYRASRSRCSCRSTSPPALGWAIERWRG